MSENGSGKKYVTLNGTELEFVGVPPLLIAKLQSVGQMPDVPTRKVRLDLDGFEDTFQEEELSADDLRDEEEKKLWKEYVTKRDEVLTLRNNGFMNAIFAKGVKVNLDHLEEWKEEQEFFGLPVPDNRIDQKVQYIQTYVISNAQEMVDIITNVLGESGVGEEELDSVRAMFRDSIRRNPAAEAERPEGEVEVVGDLHPYESSPPLGDMAAEPFLRSE